MVTKQSYPDNTLNSHSATRFALTSDLKKPPTWCPREGRNQSYIVWQAYIMAIADEMEIDILEEPPSLSQVIERYPQFHGALLYHQYQVILTEWQGINTEFFRHVRDTLIFDEIHFERDQRDIQQLKNGKLMDGRGLVQWALKFVDTSSLAAQTELIRFVGETKLSEHVTFAELEIHTNKFLNKWLLITGNNLENPGGFYDRLIISMPTRPQGSLLVALRTWLANKITDQSADLADPYTFIDKFLSHAKTIGIGDDKQEPVIASSFRVPIPGGVHVLTNKYGVLDKNHVFTREDNDCKRCDSHICQSEQWGGADYCALNPNSEFNLKTATSGQEMYGIARRGARSCRTTPPRRSRAVGCATLRPTPRPRTRRSDRQPLPSPSSRSLMGS